VCVRTPRDRRTLQSRSRMSVWDRCGSRSFRNLPLLGCRHRPIPTPRRRSRRRRPWRRRRRRQRGVYTIRSVRETFERRNVALSCSPGVSTFPQGSVLLTASKSQLLIAPVGRNSLTKFSHFQPTTNVVDVERGCGDARHQACIVPQEYPTAAREPRHPPREVGHSALRGSHRGDRSIDELRQAEKKLESAPCCPDRCSEADARLWSGGAFAIESQAGCRQSTCRSHRNRGPS
jgi:hypothetical protein